MGQTSRMTTQVARGRASVHTVARSSTCWPGRSAMTPCCDTRFALPAHSLPSCRTFPLMHHSASMLWCTPCTRQLLLSMHLAAPPVYHVHAKHSMSPYWTYSTQPGVVCLACCLRIVAFIECISERTCYYVPLHQFLNAFVPLVLFDFVFVFSCLSFVISTFDGFLCISGFADFCLLFLYFANFYIFPFLRISRSGHMLRILFFWEFLVRVGSATTNENHTHVRGPLRECRSIRSGASGLPYYCAPLVCVSAVIDSLTVWRHNKPKTKKNLWREAPPLNHGLTVPTSTLLRGMADSRWLCASCYPLHAPSRPDTFPHTYTTPLHATTFLHALTPSTRHVSKLDKIVFPKNSSQSRLARLTPSSCYGEWIPNLGALPIIASVSPQPIPCLFACFYELVPTCLSACVVSAACFVFGFYLHVYYSDFCISASIQACAFPFSWIFVHTSRHIHRYFFVFCSTFTLSLCFLSSFSQNIIDTCLTVSIDVISPSKYAYPLIPSVFPLCNLYIHHGPDYN